MKLLFPLALAATALGASAIAPAAAQQASDADVGMTKVGEYNIYSMPETSMCGAIRSWQNPKNGRIDLMLLDFADTGILGLSTTQETLPVELADGDQPITVYFVRENATVLDDSWGTMTFRLSTKEGKHYLVRNFSDEARAEFLDAMRTAEALAIYSGDTILSAFSLEGMPRAVDALESCTAKLGEVSPPQ